MRNEELAERLGVEPAWIEQRTGIRARRYAAAGESVSELAVRAGEAALREAGIAACELDLVLVATLAADDITPAAAPIVAHELGAPRAPRRSTSAPPAAARSPRSRSRPRRSRPGHAEHALVIGAEVLSRFIDTGDRSTAPLFGDGAGAIALSGRGGRADRAVRARRATAPRAMRSA